MESDPGTSKQMFMAPIKRPKATSLSSTEKTMVINMYEHFRQNWPPEERYFLKTDVAKKTAYVLGISVTSVYRIIKNFKKEGRATSPLHTKNRKNIYEKVNDGQKAKILSKLQEMYASGDIPTLNKVLKFINEDETLPNLKRSTLYRLMKQMNYEFIMKPKNGVHIKKGKNKKKEKGSANNSKRAKSSNQKANNTVTMNNSVAINNSMTTNNNSIAMDNSGVMNHIVITNNHVTMNTSMSSNNNSFTMNNQVTRTNPVTMNNHVTMNNSVTMNSPVTMNNPVPMNNPVTMNNPVIMINPVTMNNPVVISNSVTTFRNS